MLILTHIHWIRFLNITCTYHHHPCPRYNPSSLLFVSLTLIVMLHNLPSSCPTFCSTPPAFCLSHPIKNVQLKWVECCNRVLFALPKCLILTLFLIIGMTYVVRVHYFFVNELTNSNSLVNCFVHMANLRATICIA